MVPAIFLYHVGASGEPLFDTALVGPDDNMVVMFLSSADGRGYTINTVERYAKYALLAL
jgi:hypothetical protein